jgi:hypothetical protein
MNIFVPFLYKCDMSVVVNKVGILLLCLSLLIHELDYCVAW